MVKIFPTVTFFWKGESRPKGRELLQTPVAPKDKLDAFAPAITLIKTWLEENGEKCLHLLEMLLTRTIMLNVVGIK